MIDRYVPVSDDFSSPSTAEPVPILPAIPETSFSSQFDPDELAAFAAQRDEYWSSSARILHRSFAEPVDPDDKWFVFRQLGPVGPACRDENVFGSGDEEKHACGIKEYYEAHDEAECDIISLGSNNQFKFEGDFHRQIPRCMIHVFDCTLKKPPRIPKELEGVVRFYNVCLGYTSGVIGGLPYASWESAVRMTGMTQAPVYLKMDIETFEWFILLSMMEAGSDRFLPEQVAFELHIYTPAKPQFPKKTISTVAVDVLFEALYRELGYIVVDRRDNKLCQVCAEFLVVRT